jgi:hypothetical protein
LGAALDQMTELAERITTDQGYMGWQSGIFKPPRGKGQSREFY